MMGSNQFTIKGSRNLRVGECSGGRLFGLFHWREKVQAVTPITKLVKCVVIGV